MSDSELPLHLFRQKAVLFCGSVRDDLEEFIEQIDNEFSSINREVKITPKLRRKSAVVNIPGSCTLDVEEFTRSKENVCRTLKTNFADMELKWSNEAAALKDWFIKNIESCISKIELQITVTAGDLNTAHTVYEVDDDHENSSTSSEDIQEIPVQDFRSHAPAGRKRVTFSCSPETTKRNEVPAKRVKTVTKHSSSKAVLSFPSPQGRGEPVEVFSIPSARVNEQGRGKAVLSIPSFRGRSKSVEVLSIPSPRVNEQGPQSKWSDWKSLSRVVEVTPSEPGIYEIKQSRAKNTAYIGLSEDLQKCFLQYCEGKPSHDKMKKQIENFIQRNKDEISVRFEVCPSVHMAKFVQRNRLKEFQEKHNKLPAHNYELV